MMIIKLRQIAIYLFNFFYACLKIIILSKIVKVPKPISQKKEIIIFGNGPSAKDFFHKDNFLKNKEIFCVNFFAISDIFFYLKPHFYILVDPLFWWTLVDKDLEKKRNELYNNFSKVDWQMTLFIPHQAKKYKHNIKPLLENPNINVIYFNNVGIDYFGTLTFFFFKANLAVPRPINVLIPALILSINMGFKKIYLAGAENDWLRHVNVLDNNQVVIQEKHFYNPEGKTKVLKYLNKTIDQPLYEFLYNQYTVFKQYTIIAKYAKWRNVAIYNITPQSFIDAFERLKIND